MNDIKIRLVTDPKEYNDKGHDYPCLELYNEYCDMWISCKDLSFTTLEREILYIYRHTDTLKELGKKHAISRE